MIAGVPTETFPGERRVALVPLDIPRLQKLGVQALVQSGAGQQAGFSDQEYLERGAQIASSREEVFQNADALLQVRAAGANPDAGAQDLPLIRPNQAVIATTEPLTGLREAQEVASRQAVLFSMELVPRITRAQAMDVLSSQATIAGYRAVLIAAGYLSRMFPMMNTAAGTLAAARAFIVGAGVAGLQAIATSRRLGAIVHAYDVRPAVKEQVESLGARFVEMELETGEAEAAGGYAREMGEEFYMRQRQMMSDVVQSSDFVITTAAIPGQKAPILVTRDMVEKMKPGSVVVDLAAERGGNCEATRPGQTISINGVIVDGPLNLPSTIPYHASQMYSRNITSFLGLLVKEGQMEVNMDDEIIATTLVARDGQIVHPHILQLLGDASPAEGGTA